MESVNGESDEGSNARLPVPKSRGPVFASHGAHVGGAGGTLRADDLTYLLQRHHDQFVNHLDSWMEKLVNMNHLKQSGSSVLEKRLSQTSIASRRPSQSSVASGRRLSNRFRTSFKSNLGSMPEGVESGLPIADCSVPLGGGDGFAGMRGSMGSCDILEVSDASEGNKLRVSEDDEIQARTSKGSDMSDRNCEDDKPKVNADRESAIQKKKRKTNSRVQRITMAPGRSGQESVASVTSLVDTFNNLRRAGTDTSLDDLDRSRRQRATSIGDRASSRHLSVKNGEPAVGCVTRLVTSFYFEAFFAAAIITNSAVIGIQVDWAAEHPGAETPIEFYAIGFLYTFVFTMELVLRLFCEGWKFFVSDSWHWNFLDVFIVTSSLLEVVLDIVHLVSRTSVSGMGNVSNVRIVRIIRITRLIRIFRIVKIVRFIKALRTLVFSILSTLKSLLWALLLLLMIIYSFGILFAQSVSTFLDEELHDLEMLLSDHKSNASYLKAYWASLPRAMFTLFKAITGGLSWHDVVNPLSDVASWLVMLFIGFISFSTFAVLNVVTGVFCQSAIESAQHDQEMMIQTMMANKKNYIERIQKLFKNLDDDESGFITINELEAHLGDEGVQAYFSSLDLDPRDAWTLFKLLDVDKGNEVDLEEFVMGCMRLKGEAKSIDVAKLTYETKWMMKRLLEFMTYVELQFTILQESGGRGSFCFSDALSSVQSMSEVERSVDLADNFRRPQLGDIIKGVSSMKQNPSMRA